MNYGKKKKLFIAVTALIAIILIVVALLIGNKKQMTYNIFFDTDGGTSVKPQIVEEGKQVEKPEVPTKEGYKFIGWTGSNGETPELNVIISTSAAKDLTYTANWGLLGDANQDGEINLQDVIEISEFIAGKIKLTEAQKKLADVDEDGVVDSANVQVLTSYLVDDSIELPYTGHKKYRIEMNLDGGEYSGKIRNAYYDIDDITLGIPTKDEYEFIGWTGSNGETPELNVKIPKGTAQDLTYMANWKKA